MSGNNSFLVLLHIFSEDESIGPNTIALVSPKSNNFHRLSFVFLRSGVTNVLNNLSEISHVELVMELESSRSELRVLRHIYEALLSSSNNLRTHLLDVFIEFSEVTSEDLAVNSSKNFLFGDRQADGSKMSS